MVVDEAKTIFEKIDAMYVQHCRMGTAVDALARVMLRLDRSEYSEKEAQALEDALYVLLGKQYNIRFDIGKEIDKLEKLLS